VRDRVTEQSYYLNARRNGRDTGKGCREASLYLRRVDLEKSEQTLCRIERLRQLNSTREWVNDDLYRLMYKEDLYIVAYERIKSKPGNMTEGTDGMTMDRFSLDAIQGIIHAMRTEQFHFKPVRTVSLGSAEVTCYCRKAFR